MSTNEEIDDELPKGELLGGCWSCGTDVHDGSNFKRITLYGDSERDTSLACSSCASNLQHCASCEGFTDETVNIPWTSNYRCYLCASRIGSECDNCSDWQVFGNLTDGRCSDCYRCECGDCGCEDCYPNGCYDCCDNDPSRSDLINSYSFKPTPRFFVANGHTFNPLDKTPYLGMELEIGIEDINEGAELLTKAAPELIYLKEDGSVDGFEMVTHPMTLEAALSTIPFDALSDLESIYNADATPHGIHVHVSRAGFENDSHIFKWMKLIYRNAEEVKGIARRDSSEWAAFRPNDRLLHKYLAEKVRGSRMNSGPGSIRDRAGRRVYVQAERYSAINAQNRETFEVRVFQGSLDKTEIMAALELVAGSVEYTRQLTITDIVASDGWAWDSFVSWADQQGDTYRHFITLNTAVASEVAENKIVAEQRRTVLEQNERDEAERRAARRAERQQLVENRAAEMAANNTHPGCGVDDCTECDLVPVPEPSQRTVTSHYYNAIRSSSIPWTNLVVENTNETMGA